RAGGLRPGRPPLRPAADGAVRSERPHAGEPVSVQLRGRGRPDVRRSTGGLGRPVRVPGFGVLFVSQLIHPAISPADGGSVSKYTEASTVRSALRRVLSSQGRPLI